LILDDASEHALSAARPRANAKYLVIGFVEFAVEITTQ
jgi:hypothetical protein